MLLNLKKDFENGDIVSIKLVNGDEIIARYESGNDTSITVSRPLAITMSAQGMGLIPWVFLGVDTSVTISKDNTFFIVSSKGEAAKQYTEGTTGIALS